MPSGQMPAYKTFICVSLRKIYSEDGLPDEKKRNVSSCIATFKKFLVLSQTLF